MIEQLDVRILGPTEIRLDGRPIDAFGGHRPGSLLRYLLTRSGRSAHRDQLIDVFWPETDPKRARNRLQVAVSSLRRSFREATDLDVIEFQDGRYVVNTAFDLTSDYDEFERLALELRAALASGDDSSAATLARRGVRLYRGPLCPDLPYEQWVIYPRERTRMLYGDMLDTLLRIQRAEQDHEGCMDTALRILDDDPCREDAHRILMRSYLALGRRHQALRQYESCRRILRALLDKAPSAATMAAFASVRDAVEVPLSG